jgi:hypothetical protein
MAALDETTEQMTVCVVVKLAVELLKEIAPRRKEGEPKRSGVHRYPFFQLLYQIGS